MNAPTNLDARAVDHILRRMHEDPRLAAILGDGSEAFDRITEAVASRHGFDVAQYRIELGRRLHGARETV